MSRASSPDVSLDSPQGCGTKWKWRIPAAAARAYRRRAPTISETRVAREEAGPWTQARPRFASIPTSARLQRDRAGDLLGVPQLAQGLALDQPHTFAGEAQDLPGLAQAERTPRVQPVAELHHVALALVEHAVHGVADLLAEEGVLHLGELPLGVGLLGEVADLVDRGVEGLGQLLAARFPTHLLRELEPRAVQLAQAVVDVHRQADRARTIGDRARDPLTDPPRRVGGELEAAPPVEQLDRAHQPDVPLLDEVEQREPLALVLPGHGDHQTQVGHDEPLAGGLGLADVGPGPHDRAIRAQAAGLQAVLGLLALLDGHGEHDLLLLGEERLSGRGLQVQAEVVGVVGAQWASRFGHFLPWVLLQQLPSSGST